MTETGQYSVLILGNGVAYLNYERPNSDDWFGRTIDGTLSTYASWEDFQEWAKTKGTPMPKGMVLEAAQGLHGPFGITLIDEETAHNIFDALRANSEANYNDLL